MDNMFNEKYNKNEEIHHKLLNLEVNTSKFQILMIDRPAGQKYIKRVN